MEEIRKDFVAILMRFFQTRSFPKNLVYFKYDGTMFPVAKIDVYGIHYGSQPWLMPESNKGYVIKKVHLKRSIIGQGCVFEIDDRV